MFMRSMLRVSCTLLALLVTAVPAQAALVTWEFYGTVTDLGPFAPFPVGTAVRFVANFDTSTPDECAHAGSGFYPQGSGSVTVLGQTYHADWTALEVNNPAGNCSGPIPDQPQSISMRYVGFSGAPFYAATLGWGTAQLGDSFPTVVPTHAYFGFGRTCVVCLSGGGTITHIQVPAPPMVWALGTGLVGWVVRRRWRP